MSKDYIREAAEQYGGDKHVTFQFDDVGVTIRYSRQHTFARQRTVSWLEIDSANINPIIAAIEVMA